MLGVGRLTSHEVQMGEVWRGSYLCDEWKLP